MPSVYGTTVALLLATACSDAFGQSASFTASIRLLPERVTAGASVELPMPPQAQVLPPGRHARRLLFVGSPDDARRFYEDTLPGLGFHLSRQKTDGAIWERGDVRAELLFYPVVGGREATGIIVVISPRPSQDSATHR